MITTQVQQQSYDSRSQPSHDTQPVIPTAYVDAMYRPTNANFVRVAQDFKYPYSVLYPVHGVATFEHPITWETKGEEESSMSSSSRSLSFECSRSATIQGRSVFSPDSTRNFNSAMTTGTTKKKKSCCAREPKAMTGSSELHHKPAKQNRSMCCGGGSKTQHDTTHVVDEHHLTPCSNDYSVPHNRIVEHIPTSERSTSLREVRPHSAASSRSNSLRTASLRTASVKH